MRRLAINVSSRCLFMAVFIVTMAFCGNGFAGQLKFGDWVGLEAIDSLTHKKSKKIGTFAKDGVSTLWLSDSESGEDTIQLILESKESIASEYFSYRIDSVDTLTINSAVKGCQSNCLTDNVPRQGELIQALKRGLRIRFEYDSDPDVAQNPAFSLRGFTRAYNWLLTE